MIPAVFKSARDGIATEEALFQTGRPLAILWQSEETSVVVPKGWARQKAFPQADRLAAQEGWPILLRSSGGGAVPQGPGTLNLAMILRDVPDLTIEEGFRVICGVISDVLARFGLAYEFSAVEGAFCDGAWNVTVGGRKLAGTAQRWRCHNDCKVALVHAAILMDRPDPVFWPVLEHVEHAVGSTLEPNPDAHVALSDLLPGPVRSGELHNALIQSANAALDRISTLGKQAA